MPNASYLQTNFLGGEWSPFAQGRADMEQYRTALNLCYNNLPIEVGACTRRPGTLVCATTRNGVYGVIKDFNFSQNQPYLAEFTPGFLRIFAGTSLLLEDQRSVSGISSADPAVASTVLAHGYSTGDQVEFAVSGIPGISPAGPAPLYNRQFSITVIDTTHFSLADPVTGVPLDGSTVNVAGFAVTVAKIVTFTNDYTLAELPNLRLVQDENVAFICLDTEFPKALINTVLPGVDQEAVFTWTTPTFSDGPYLDPPTDGTTLTPSAQVGTINLTASSIASINSGLGFVSTDVGRLIRLFSQPSAWASGTSYAAGQNVLYQNVAYAAVQANRGIEPDTDNGTNWTINPSGQAWTWATIKTIVSASEVSATLAPADPYGILPGGPLLFSNAMLVWQLGLYSETTGYPSGGCFHEGRFWLFGAVGNRMDSNMSNNNGYAETGNFLFSPTLLDGTVADNCGISAVFNGTDRNTIFWAQPDGQGIVIGTQAGEWLMQASSLNEPITPTSIQAHRVTKYGCADVEPVYAGFSHVFVQRYNLAVYEFIADVYTSKYSGVNIALKAKHITSPGVAQLAYQAQKAPIVWARTVDGRLLSCTYKRERPTFGGGAPAFFSGWAHHALGSGRTVTQIQAGPSPSGATDSLSLVTQDPVTGYYYVEVLSSIPDELDTLLTAWFVDGAVTPVAAAIVGTNLVLYGLSYVNGDTLTAWIGGVDAGDYVVTNGTLTIPLDGTANGSGGTLFTQALLDSLSGSTYENLDLAITVTPAGQGFFSPVGAALGYTSTSNSGNYAQGPTAAVFDWANDVLYEQRGATGSDPETNDHTLFAFSLTTRAQLWQSDPGNIAFDNAWVAGYDGNIYSVEGFNGTHFRRFNVTTKVVDIDWASGLGAASAYIAPIQVDGIDYVFTTGLNSGGGGGSSAPWFLANVSGPGGPGLLATGVFDEQQSSIAPGNAFPAQRGRAGAAYCAVNGQTLGTGAFQIGIYAAVVDSTILGGVGKVGVVTPTAVHAGLTSIAVTCQPIYDETDGNLILLTVGSDSVIRLVKVSLATAAVLWTYTLVGNNDMSRSRIQGGRMTIIDGGSSPYTLIDLDTIAGTATTTTETVITPSMQASDDLYGIVTANEIQFGATQWVTFGPNSSGGAITPAVIYNSPAIVGFNYQSQAQILRAVSPQEGGFQTGPGQGKLRRTNHAAPYLANAQYVQMGVDFRVMRQIPLTSPGGTVPLTLQQLYTGIVLRAVDDNDSFNSMWCWQSTRPYPATVVSVECFLEGKDLV